MIRQFEELSNNAWPALQSMQYDGWTLRFAGGVTKRSNSISMLYPSTLDPEEKIGYCEKLYRAHKITPCFKITSIARPEDIDGRLDRRGYFIHSHISFQTISVAHYSFADSQLSLDNSFDLTLENQLNPSWIGHFIRMNGFGMARKPVYEGIMQKILTPKCLVTIQHDQKAVAVGLGVTEGRYVGIFDLVVDPTFRNRGLAIQVMHAILAWASQSGAETAYLQVLTDNKPAIRLYEKLGFTECYKYWYRMGKLL